MFNKNIALEHLQQWNKNTIGDHLGIEYLEIGEDYIAARMPVDHRTHQPFGILHGGGVCCVGRNPRQPLVIPAPPRHHQAASRRT